MVRTAGLHDSSSSVVPRTFIHARRLQGYHRRQSIFEEMAHIPVRALAGGPNSVPSCLELLPVETPMLA